MSLKGFTPVPSTQTYHHTPGKVRGYAEVDRGYKNYLQDEDPRDGFIRMGNSQVILGTDPDKELSFKSKFQRGTEICLVHEWSDQDQYSELEVRRSELGTVTAELSTIESGEYRRYKADPARAQSLLGELETDFNATWNIAS
jgi:hypothetical protein